MIKRIRYNWNKLSLGEKRKIIVLGIENIILFVMAWTIFISVMYALSVYMDRTVELLENIERVLMG